MTTTRQRLAEELFRMRYSGWRFASDWEYLNHGSRWELLQMASRLLDLAERVTSKWDLELAVQEALLRWGWKNPLRDAARLVDGPLQFPAGVAS